jgi:hypothetical protein
LKEISNYNDKPSATLSITDELTLPEVLPGFAVPMADIFE